MKSILPSLSGWLVLIAMLGILALGDLPLATAQVPTALALCAAAAPRGLLGRVPPGGRNTGQPPRTAGPAPTPGQPNASGMPGPGGGPNARPAAGPAAQQHDQGRRPTRRCCYRAR